MVADDDDDDDDDKGDKEDRNFDIAEFLKGSQSDFFDTNSDLLYEATYDSDGLRKFLTDSNSPRNKILDTLKETYEALIMVRAKSQGIGNKGKNEAIPASVYEVISDLENKLKTQIDQLAEVMKPEKILRVSTLSQKGGISKIVATFDTGKLLTIQCNEKNEANFIDGLYCKGKSKYLSELQNTLCDRLSSYTSFQNLQKHEERTKIKPGRPGRK